MMKLKRVVFSTLFGLAMVGQLLALPVKADPPTVRDWNRENPSFGVGKDWNKKIGKAFDKYHTGITALDTREGRQPKVQRPNGKTITRRDYQARLTLTEKLENKLRGFINNRELNTNRPLIEYLKKAFTETERMKTTFAKLQQEQAVQLAEAGIIDQNARDAFNEDEKLREVMQLIQTAEAKFLGLSTKIQNAQNAQNAAQLSAARDDVLAVYRRDIRAISLALGPLKLNLPGKYTDIVDEYDTRSADLNTQVNQGATAVSLFARMTLAVRELKASLDDL